jgi:hypothetical protein
VCLKFQVWSGAIAIDRQQTSYANHRHFNSEQGCPGVSHGTAQISLRARRIIGNYTAERLKIYLLWLCEFCGAKTAKSIDPCAPISIDHRRTPALSPPAAISLSLGGGACALVCMHWQ